jgi:hypothetical protein
VRQRGDDRLAGNPAAFPVPACGAARPEPEGGHRDIESASLAPADQLGVDASVAVGLIRQLETAGGAWVPSTGIPQASALTVNINIRRVGDTPGGDFRLGSNDVSLSRVGG